MKHLSEQEMVMYFYGESGRKTRAHLTECEHCQRELRAIQDLLRRVEAPSVPERPADYGLQVWNSIRARLPEPQARARFAWLLPPQRWAIAGATIALMLAAFIAGRYWSKPSPTSTTTQVVERQPAENVRERILLVAVGDHLERSQMVLLELVNATPGKDLDISSEQQQIEELISANRLYRQTAAGAGKPAMADVLDELERVLLDIAHRPSAIGSAELRQIQQRIESQGILFKVRVVGSRARSSNRTSPTRKQNTTQETRREI
jgi:hypothetical protein